MAYNDRPPGVTLVAFLAWVSAILQIGVSVLVLTGAIEPRGASLAGTWFTFAVGLVTLLVSFGLFGANNVARVLVTISLVLSIVAAIFHVLGRPDGNVLVSAIITTLLAVVGIALLFTKRANRFFS